MKEELKKKKRENQLKNFARAAGAGGIAEDAKDFAKSDIGKKVGKAVNDAANKFVEGAKASAETVGSMAKDLLKKKRK